MHIGRYLAHFQTWMKERDKKRKAIRKAWRGDCYVRSRINAHSTIIPPYIVDLLAQLALQLRDDLPCLLRKQVLDPHVRWR